MVGVGVLLGVAGGGLQALSVSGLVFEPAPRFGAHLVSRGMMLAVVLGLGGLLAPTFAMVPDPLRIVGIAKAGQRGPRRAFLAGLALLITGALAAEAAGHPQVAAWTRAVAATASVLLAWKLGRFPFKQARLPWALLSAGACTLAGVIAAAVLPEHEIAAWHVTFIGGYGLLTLAIGTRVVVSHGGHPHTDEAKLLGIATLACIALALAARLAAGEVDPTLAHALATAAALWSLAWVLWLAGALPRVLEAKRGKLMTGGHR